MVAHQADVHIRFLKLQLFTDLPFPLDGKLVNPSAFNHHTHYLGYLFNSPACQTSINLDSLSFVIYHYCSVKKHSFVVYCSQLMCPYLQWMGVTITQS